MQGTTETERLTIPSGRFYDEKSNRTERADRRRQERRAERRRSRADRREAEAALNSEG